LISPAGTVALSIPTKAQSAIAIAAGKVLIPDTFTLDTVLSIAGLKCKAAIITNTTRAATFSIVVTILTMPAPLTPIMFIIVKNHNTPEVIKNANKGVAAIGTKYVK
jgi:hypothetical protein